MFPSSFRQDFMANREQLAIIKQGVAAWNRWRTHNRFALVDLYRADLSGMNLSRANLFKADLHGANLNQVNLAGANLSESKLSDANLSRTDLTGADLGGVSLFLANLSGAKLVGADLSDAILSRADLSGADLSGANLTEANLVQVNFEKAKLNECRIYGISAWNLKLDGAEQQALVITPEGEPTITVDNLEVAQFIYLLLNNERIRDVIDTVGRKAVLILGRFTEERKAVLDAIREELRRHHDYLPIMFDFPRPDSKSYIQTVTTLAHLVRFVIADVTDPKVILEEMLGVFSKLPSLPVQPLLMKGSNANVVLTDFSDFPGFSEFHLYTDIEDLLASLADKVIAPAEEKAKRAEERRNKFEETLRAMGSI